MADDEPVGYLGGSTSSREDDPYADPYADSAAGADDEVEGYLGGAAAPSADDEVEGYLGGSAAPSADDEVEGYLGGAAAITDEAPALPGQAGAEGGYSASDLLGAEEQDPYADPYAQEQDPYADPYAAAEGDAGYDAYDEYGTAAEDDAAYFDSMGHQGGDEYAGGTAVDDYPTETVDDYGGDDDSPKTISQQDAESIIRRITTKRILPPESGGVATAPTPQRLTTGGGGLRVAPILFVVVLLAAGAVWVFREPIAERYPELGKLLGVAPKKETPVEVVKTEDPQVKKKRELLEKVLASEAKAFGTNPKDLGPIKVSSAAPGADAPKEEVR